MKQFTLVKHHPCTQLAHLYEHMFLATAAEFMYQQGQYQVIDYTLDGHTYPGGTIVIKSMWYSVDATRLANKLSTMPTDFGEMDNEPVSLALYRLLAEEPNQLYVADSGRMMHELKRLDSHPWQNIDNIKRLNSSSPSQTNGIIYSTSQPASIPRRLYISFQLAQQFRQQRPETLPLFYEYVHFLNLSISQKLGYQFGAYTDETHVKYHADDMSITNTLHLSTQSGPIQFADIIHCVRTVARDLRAPGLNQRFVDYLHGVSYTDNPAAAPDIDRMLLDLGILLGSAGWHAIATPDNVNDVAQTTQIIAKYGNQSDVIE